MPGKSGINNYEMIRPIITRKSVSVFAGATIGLFIVGPVVVSLLKFDFLNHSKSFIQVLNSTYKNFIWEFDFESIITGLLFLLGGAAIGYLFYRYKTPMESNKDNLCFEDFIERGECETIEFKSSLRWDRRQNKINKEVESAVLKSIAAFMNTSGGFLVIGVCDDGNILGLENDYNTLKKRDKDGFEQFIIQSVSLTMGADRCKDLSISFFSRQDKEICLVKIDQAKIPVFVKNQSNVSFFVRAGNTTRELNVEEVLNYNKERKMKNTYFKY